MTTIGLENMTPLLQVFDMARSVAFYRDLLGFALIAQSRSGEEFGWCLLRRDKIELMLNTAYDLGERPEAPDPARVLAHRDTALFFLCPDVDAAYRALRDAGLAMDPPWTAPYGMRQLSFPDPDGYEICLQWPV